jgi:hypothetical protein
MPTPFGCVPVESTVPVRDGHGRRPGDINPQGMVKAPFGLNRLMRVLGNWEKAGSCYEEKRCCAVVQGCRATRYSAGRR